MRGARTKGGRGGGGDSGGHAGGDYQLFWYVTVSFSISPLNVVLSQKRYIFQSSVIVTLFIYLFIFEMRTTSTRSTK